MGLKDKLGAMIDAASAKATDDLATTKRQHDESLERRHEANVEAALWMLEDTTITAMVNLSLDRVPEGRSVKFSVDGNRLTMSRPAGNGKFQPLPNAFLPLDKPVALDFGRAAGETSVRNRLAELRKEGVLVEFQSTDMERLPVSIIIDFSRTVPTQS